MTTNDETDATATGTSNDKDGAASNNGEDSSMDVSLHEKWRESYSFEMERLLQLMPKVELHVHLDGSFDPPLLYRQLWKERQGIFRKFPPERDLPYDPAHSPLKLRQMVTEASQDYVYFQSLCTCRGRASLIAMFHCFEVFLPIVQGNLDLMEEMAHDFVQRQAQQFVLYTEVRYSPHLLLLPKQEEQGDDHPQQELTVDQVVDAITRGIRRGEQDFSVTVKQILCCLSRNPEWSMDVVRLASERRESAGGNVVGIDIAAGEEHYNETQFPELHQAHYQAMQRAKELNLKVTVHAAEVGDASHVPFAVEKYHARRIGHGYRIVNQEHLMKDMARRGIFFEVCPTSSVETGGWDWKTDPTDKKKNWKQHPTTVMMDHGIKVGFSSDDPAVFQTSLMWQLRIAVGKMGLSLTRILQSMQDSMDAAFTDDVELKEKIRQQLRDFQVLHKDALEADTTLHSSAQQHTLQSLESGEFIERVAGFENLLVRE